MIRNLAILPILIFMLGCELPESENAEDAAEIAATIDETAGAEGDVATAEEAEWAAIRWHGSGESGAVQVMTLSASIASDGQRVSFNYSHYPWNAMGLAHFFWWNGSTWQGGKFDWIRRGGQSVKLTENIRHGYNSLRVPRSGTPVAFAWTSADGRQRSNLAKTTWP